MRILCRGAGVEESFKGSKEGTSSGGTTSWRMQARTQIVELAEKGRKG
jgi:hypothetical protein